MLDITRQFLNQFLNFSFPQRKFKFTLEFNALGSYINILRLIACVQSQSLGIASTKTLKLPDVEGDYVWFTKKKISCLSEVGMPALSRREREGRAVVTASLWLSSYYQTNKQLLMTICLLKHEKIKIEPSWLGYGLKMSSTLCFNDVQTNW